MAGLVAVALRLERFQQLALLAGQVQRRLDRHLHIQIAALRAAEDRKTLAAQPELVAGLGARRDLHLRARAVDHRHLHFAAKRRPGHGQRQADQQIGALALEQLVRLQRHMHIQISVRRPGAARLPFAGQTDTGAILHAGGNGYLQRALALHGAQALTNPAGIAYHPTGAAAGRAGPFDHEEALLRAHLALAVAGAAGQVGTRLIGRSGAIARLARQPGRYPQIGLGAGKRIAQADLDLRTQVRAATRAATRTVSPAGELAEHLVEDIAEPAAIGEVEPASTRAAVLLEGRMAIPVVGRPLLLVLQNVIGLVQFLEPGLRCLVVRIAVGMVLHSQLAVRFLQVIRAGVARHTQGGVKILLGHIRPFGSALRTGAE